MPETAATARETAQKLRALAKASSATYGNAYLVMADWWDQQAVKLEVAEQAQAAPLSDSNGCSRAA